MPLPSKRLAFFLAAALLCAPAARALIIYGTDANDTDLTRNTTAPVGDVANPANDAPWANVIQFGVNNASGVYLGNGYILTANHVNPIPDSFFINGVSCNRDTAFEPMQVTEDVLPTGFPGTIQKPVTDVIDFVDLKLVKVLNPPAMTTLPINYYTGTIGGPTSDLGGTSVLIGCGVGKGSIVTDGWNWGGGGTYAKRWGTNSAGGYKVAGTSTYFESLYTIFNATVGDESQIAVGDSGSGLFKKFGTTWKLTGVASAVSTVGSALYSPSDASFFVRMSKYAHLLRYENWANTKLGSPTAAVTADPDKDGLPNLLEYAFHTDPNTASFPPSSVSSSHTTSPVAAFRHFICPFMHRPYRCPSWPSRPVMMVFSVSGSFG